MALANRICVFLLIVAMVAFAGGSGQASARHGTSQIELCDGDRIVLISVDREGRPVQDLPGGCDCLFCTHCGTADLALMPGVAIPLVTVQARSMHPAGAPAGLAGSRPDRARARAPPDRNG
ncbi:MAG: hypothetical protein Q4G25_11080 [Paracoccus sp. (in: a-proteobacteria)]|nr:hypothetical protein [Paracoccus sp. (in: a-proteobacteria)]